MIPGEFEYKRPGSKREALAMLAESGGAARPLSGGHSLIPMMKLRMATPEVLVDIRSLSELHGVEIGGEIRIGAAVTQHDLIASDALVDACPIVRETALQIADPQVRYCGTIGGNVGNGDPGNDMPALMQCLDADYVAESVDGTREIKARDFYQGAYFTALEPNEIITQIKFRRPAKGHGYSYQKLKRKIGDYATAAAAVILEVSDGKIKRASIALTNVADTPLYAEKAVEIVTGTDLAPDVIDAAVAAAEAITAPASDGRGTAEYRTKMAGVMVRRALETAMSRADNEKGGLLGWLKR